MTKRLLVTGLLVLGMGCRRGPAGPPPYVVTVSVGPDFVSMGASFPTPTTVSWHNGECSASRVIGEAESTSLDGGRVETWIVAGPILGHTDRSPEGVYRAAVRALVPQGTRLAAEIAGGRDVPHHRWRTPARVPAPVTRSAPTAGFALRAGSGLPIAWQGGDSSHVAISATVAIREIPVSAPVESWIITCVVPRATARYTIPAEAFAAAQIRTNPRSVSVAVVACDRAQEGAYALDVTPVARAEDLVTGRFTP